MKDLTDAIRGIVERARDAYYARDDHSQNDRDIIDLADTLARLLDGHTVYRSFGAPGDWGYGTPIGTALARLYRADATVDLTKLAVAIQETDGSLRFYPMPPTAEGGGQP